MAQSLDNRINAALRSAARLKDVEGVITDVGAEIAATQLKLNQETARSIDPALTTPEARQARNNAADLEHDIRRLNASLSMLQERRQGLLDDQEQVRKLAKYEAAKANRESIVADLRGRYPALALEIVSLVDRLQASEDEVRAANRDRPSGRPELEAPEIMARDHPTSLEWSPMEPVLPLHRARLPMLRSGGMYLPIPHAEDLAACAIRNRALSRETQDHAEFQASDAAIPAGVTEQTATAA